MRKIFSLLLVFGILLMSGAIGSADLNRIDNMTYLILGLIGIGLMITGYIGLRKIGGLDFDR